MSKYKGIIGPNKEELDEIEKMFNPDNLKNEDLFAEINEDAFYADEFLDTSRTESGYRRKIKDTHENKSKGDKISVKKVEEISEITPIENIEISVREYNILKRSGINTVGDVIAYIENDKGRERNLSTKFMEEVLSKLSVIGIELKNNCEYCHTILTDEDLSNVDGLCGNCRERVARTRKAKDITLEILPPVISSYTGGYSGFHIYVNIKNNTSSPVKLELKECTVFKEGRQHACECNLTGYSFSEDYIFPNSVKTFAKIWKTSDLEDSTLYYDDCLTISLKDSSGGKVYFYKYNYNQVRKTWYFYDYYELD